MKTILFASVAALALAASAPAFAQTPTDKPAASADKPAADATAKPAKTVKAKAAPAAAKEHTLTGTVKTFDADKHMMTFASGKEFTLDASITDTFKAGDKVSAHYTMKGGKRMADKVTKS